MNLADILVVLFIVGLLMLWFFLKKKNPKNKDSSRCIGCANYGLCKNKKEGK